MTLALTAALAFLPTDVFVNVGDTITWNFDAAEVHTVSFLAPGQTPPPAGTAPKTGDNFACDGTQFVNSGILTGPGTSYSVAFNATGDYNYLCLIHVKTMTARVHVNPAGRSGFTLATLWCGPILTRSHRTLSHRFRGDVCCRRQVPILLLPAC